LCIDLSEFGESLVLQKDFQKVCRRRPRLGNADQFVEHRALLIHSDGGIREHFAQVRVRLQRLFPFTQLALHFASFTPLQHNICERRCVAARYRLYAHRAAPMSSMLREINRTSSSGRMFRLIISSANRTLCSAVKRRRSFLAALAAFSMSR